MFTFLQCLYTAMDPPYLVYVLYRESIKVANIDGSNPRTLVDGILPVYVQYDLRYGAIQAIIINVQHWYEPNASVSLVWFSILIS